MFGYHRVTVSISSEQSEDIIATGDIILMRFPRSLCSLGMT